MRVKTVLCLVIVCVVSLVSVATAKSKPVIASLFAKWKSTPLILEASEFMADESPEAFWKFVEKIVSFNVHRQSSINQHVLYDMALKAAEQTLGVSRMSPIIKLLKFSLSLRSYSPKIEMFHQLALDVPVPSCDLVFEVKGQTFCNWDEASKVLREGTGKPSALYKQDHIYPGSSASQDDTVIVYGNILSAHFKDAHLRMSTLSGAGKLRYVFRHYVRARPEGAVKVSGFGVELALKKTEYKAVDDSEVKDDSESSENEEAQDEVIEGFDFAMLRKLNPDLSPQLTKFRSHLQETTNEMRPMKVWQLQDLSFQAAARVLSSPPRDQLRVLKDISGNFPLRARALIKQQVSTEMRKEIKKNQKHNFPNSDVEPGGHALLINGIQIDLDTTDIFTLLEILRSESRMIDGLTHLKVKESNLGSFLHLDIKSKPDSNYLDMRDPSVIWLNDLEHDSRYSSWPSNLHGLLRPAFPGTLRRLRRNWCHLVFVVDPTSPEMNHLMSTAEALWANDIPIRFGISLLIFMLIL